MARRDPDLLGQNLIPQLVGPGLFVVLALGAGLVILLYPESGHGFPRGPLQLVVGLPLLAYGAYGSFQIIRSIARHWRERRNGD